MTAGGGGEEEEEEEEEEESLGQREKGWVIGVWP